MKPKLWGMRELFDYFQSSKEKFGNPDVVLVGPPNQADKEIFDLRWNPDLWLRWTWADPGALRREKDEGSFLACALSGIGKDGYRAHLELKDDSNVWLYVSRRYEDFPGKVEKNPIVRCLTEQGQWAKDALEAGLKYLEKI